jgi:hypothetical protein
MYKNMDAGSELCLSILLVQYQVVNEHAFRCVDPLSLVTNEPKYMSMRALGDCPVSWLPGYMVPGRYVHEHA